MFTFSDTVIFRDGHTCSQHSKTCSSTKWLTSTPIHWPVLLFCRKCTVTHVSTSAHKKSYLLRDNNTHPPTKEQKKTAMTGCLEWVSHLPFFLWYPSLPSRSSFSGDKAGTYPVGIDWRGWEEKHSTYSHHFLAPLESFPYLSHRSPLQAHCCTGNPGACLRECTLPSACSPFIPIPAKCPRKTDNYCTPHPLATSSLTPSHPGDHCHPSWSQYEHMPVSTQPPLLPSSSPSRGRT